MTTLDDRWERFLDPDRLRPSLFLATMFVTTFEILKDTVVARVRDFYSTNWGNGQAAVGLEYQRDVASRNESLLYASIGWLLEQGAIDPADVENFESLKKTRNLLSHELFAVVTGQVESDHEVQFPILYGLLHKIGVWWVVNVEIPTNPALDDQEVDESGIVPGTVLGLQMLMEVAAGNTQLLEHWRKMRGKP